MKNLKFRRQFLLSDKPVEIDGSWNHQEFKDTKHGLNLYHHPDLELTHVQLEDKLIVLLGYAIDPFHPDFSNSDILNNISHVSDLNELFTEVENLSGRFVILYCNDNGKYLFHDAIGLREIYYCFSEKGNFCGSTPDIINEYAKMELDKDESLKEFINSKEYKTTRFWVGNKTLFKNIYHLLPNLYLDLNKKTSHRYWPDKKRSQINVKEGAELMAQILKGTFLAAEKRYELHQTLTAGNESRLLLAASKDVKDKIKYKVIKLDRATNYADIKVPSQLAKAHNLDLEIMEIDNVDVDDEFRKIFKSNNVLARDTHMKVHYDAYEKKYDDTFWVTGSSGNEIFRIDFPMKKKRITSFDIARFFKYNEYSYAVNEIENWLKDAGEVYGKYGYNLLNMFFWEQYVPNFQSLGASEGDIVREELRPLNNRKLISTFLSLHDKYRYKYYPAGYMKIIEILWKDVLKVPIGAMDIPRYKIRRVLRFLGIEIMVSNIKASIRTKLYYRGK